MNKRYDLLEAVSSKYQAEMLIAESNIRTYIENAAGIGEHADIVEAVDEQIKRWCDAHENATAAETLMAKFKI